MHNRTHSIPNPPTRQVTALSHLRQHQPLAAAPLEEPGATAARRGLRVCACVNVHAEVRVCVFTDVEAGGSDREGASSADSTRLGREDPPPQIHPSTARNARAPRTYLQHAAPQGQHWCARREKGAPACGYCARGWGRGWIVSGGQWSISIECQRWVSIKSSRPSCCFRVGKAGPGQGHGQRMHSLALFNARPTLISMTCCWIKPPQQPPPIPTPNPSPDAPGAHQARRSRAPSHCTPCTRRTPSSAGHPPRRGRGLSIPSTSSFAPSSAAALASSSLTQSGAPSATVLLGLNLGAWQPWIDQSIDPRPPTLRSTCGVRCSFEAAKPPGARFRRIRSRAAKHGRARFPHFKVGIRRVACINPASASPRGAAAMFCVPCRMRNIDRSFDRLTDGLTD